MNVMSMNRYIKLIITVIAITSILCCVPVASAVDATEPTEEQATESVTVQAIEHEAICCILLAIGIPSGCMIAQGFSFWKW